jgi:hypothetical protein
MRAFCNQAFLSAHLEQSWFHESIREITNLIRSLTLV